MRVLLIRLTQLLGSLGLHACGTFARGCSVSIGKELKFSARRSKWLWNLEGGWACRGGLGSTHELRKSLNGVAKTAQP